MGWFGGAGRRAVIKLARTTTGTVLFLCDVALLALTWPVLLWAGNFSMAPLVDCRAVAYPACDLVLLFAMGLYRRDAIQDTRRSLSRVPLVVVMGAVAAVILSYLQGLLLPGGVVPSEQKQLVMFGLAVADFSLVAFFARAIVSVLLRRHVLRRRLMIIGAGQRAWELLLILGREGSSLHDDVFLVHAPSFGEVDDRLASGQLGKILRPADFDVASAARQVGADLVIVAPDDRRGMNLHRLLACKRAGFPVIEYLTFVEKEIRRIDIKRIELGWLVFGDGFTFGALDRFLKRVFDLVVSSVVLVLTAPLIVAGVIAIRLEGPGPVFYRQERVTQDERVFWILKLRTMRPDAESKGAVWAAVKDNRITRTGNFLRRARIDELPQLVNILRGDMSFVGPRPERPMFVKELAEQIPLYNERHMVKAGLTGWAQINYPYGASVDDARSKLSYDLYYVKNFSILFDFVILLQTLRVVLWPSGVR
jgi:sugar transferase (PEP-CTERM system associated)